MAWIESNQELGRHPKMKKLARLLSISWPEAVGYLHYLWWWALDFAQDGDLTKYEAGDIADAVLWQGEPTELVNALGEAGFLDKTEDGCLVIHDWFDYAGRLIEKREANRERMRKARAKAKDAGSPHVQNTNNARSGATVPNSTVPNQPNSTEQNNTKPDQPENTPKPSRSKRKKEPDPAKTDYAEFVSLTDDEYAALVTKLGEEGAKRCIEILDNYKGANGKKYKSDYRAILNWVIERFKEEKAKGGDSVGQAGKPFRRPPASSEDWSSFKPSTGFKRSHPDEE